MLTRKMKIWRREGIVKLEENNPRERKRKSEQAEEEKILMLISEGARILKEKIGQKKKRYQKRTEEVIKA